MNKATLKIKHDDGSVKGAVLEFDGYLSFQEILTYLARTMDRLEEGETVEILSQEQRQILKL